MVPAVGGLPGTRKSFTVYRVPYMWYPWMAEDIEKSFIPVSRLVCTNFHTKYNLLSSWKVPCKRYTKLIFHELTANSQNFYSEISLSSWTHAFMKICDYTVYRIPLVLLKYG